MSVAARIASGSAYAYRKTVPMREEPRSVDKCAYRFAGSVRRDDDFPMVRSGERDGVIGGSIASGGGVVTSISCRAVGTAARIKSGVSGSRRWLSVPLRDCYRMVPVFDGAGITHHREENEEEEHTSKMIVTYREQ